MKNNKWIFYVFVALAIVAIVIGCIYAVTSLSTETYTFSSDGYILYSNPEEDLKTQSLSFSGGTDYSYKKFNGKIAFASEEGQVSVDDSAVIHYADSSFMTLKNVVGLDLTTIDSKIIFYYNIYKNTLVSLKDAKYSVTAQGGENIVFNNLLFRINENKYLLLGDNIRATLTNDEVIDFGSYVYFEYSDGSIIRIYNNTKGYQTIASDSKIVVGENVIDLSTKVISKQNTKYITLSNLVIDNDGNIDLIVEEPVKLPTISTPNVGSGSGTDGSGNGSGGNTVVGGGEDSSGSTTGGESSSDSDEFIPTEEEEDPLKNLVLPTFKITEMITSPVKLDATIEITDDDNLLTSAPVVKIVQNATSKVIYEYTASLGDTNIPISIGNLYPDTEYTITCNADYEIDGEEYNRTFLSKIMRSEALGVTFEKSYATASSLAIKVIKESYSDVSSITLNIYDQKNNKLDDQVVYFQDEDETQEIIFENLDSNTKYNIVMSEILCNGLSVTQGYSEKKTMITLKQKPVIGELQYEIDKRNSIFNLSVKDITDTDYGIESYRYEIYDSRVDINTEEPIVTLTNTDKTAVKAKVDNTKLEREVAYTYRLVVVFNDNEKIVEYVKDLGTTIQLDGVQFPSVRFEKTYITFEQINGTIIVDDPGGAIVSDKYKVVYKNSLGVYTSKEITASTDSEAIPINVNNLRANETYTFEVFADIDLQDDNEPVDEAYIGSVFVQTEKPNNLVATYSESNDYLSAFGVNLRLTNQDQQDASLEASTLSEVTFTLYQGSSTSGAKEVFKKVVDLNEDDYQSTIKDAFYDSTTLLNPAFFNTKNTDYTEKTYTLTITDAYDYTDYDNEIPIINADGKPAEYTFSINSYIPDIPTDSDNAIIATKVLNKTAESFGLTYDNNLLPNTVVGYNLVTNYLNEAGNATRFVYHVWKYDTTSNTYVKIDALDIEVPFNEDGMVDPVLVQLGYGTPDSTNDVDMLRRGNKYYFSYEVYLDIDGDKIEDGVYPSMLDKDVVLKSPELSPSKQASSFQLYPSISDANSATWKYKYTDVDNSLYQNKLFAYIGNATTSSSSADIQLSEEFLPVKFGTFSKEQFYTIKKHERLLKPDAPEYTSLTSQYFYGFNSSLDLTFSSKIDNNQLVLSIDDYYEKTDTVDLIASADVKIVPVNSDDLANLGTKTITNLILDAGNIFIDLFDISAYMTVPFNAEVTIYMDSGNTGFDVGSTFKAIQKGTISSPGNYYYINESNNLAQNSIIVESEYQTQLDLANNLLKITNKFNKSLDLVVSIDETGVVYANNNILLKELKTQKLSSADVDSTIFDIVIPSVTLLKNNILPLLKTVEINPTISVANGVYVQDEKVYIEIWETDENGVNATYLKTVEKTLTELKKKVILDGLNPKTNYYIRFYAYISNDQKNYNLSYLYDTKEQKIGIPYKFQTLSDVGIDNIVVSFNKKAYLDKQIYFTYTLENLQGYDYIGYKLYELVDDTYQLVNIDLPSARAFYSNMSLTIEAPAGNEYGFAYGKQYKLDIIPIGSFTDVDGTLREIDLGKKEFEFTLDDFEEPYIGISAGKTSDTIYFRVSIDDTSKVVNNDKYSVKLMDASYNPIAEEFDISTDTINKVFTYSAEDHGLQTDQVYIFMVTIQADYTNSQSNYTTLNKTKSIRFGDTVNLGSVTASKNANDDYTLDIVFADSYKLDTIKKITYTVSSTTVDYFSTGTTDFVIRYEQNSGIYIYSMNLGENDNFVTGNVYTITMNFYGEENNLLAQEEINYYYGGSS